MSVSAERARRQNDDLAGQLWEMWRQGQRPAVSEFLAAAGPLALGTLVAVLRVDQQQRWLAGERVPAERYLADHPELLAEEDHAIELIYCEYLVREELGDHPGLEEYLDRFPAFQQRLRVQLDVHLALGGLSSAALIPVPPLPTQATLIDPCTNDDPDKTRATRPPELAPAFTAPGYEIIQELGRGGMGIVYRARERASGRMVALKVMQGIDPAGLYRFKQEFRSLAGLSHPNLISLYELSAEGPTWFFTMELLEGSPFLEHVRGAAARDDLPLPAANVDRLRSTLIQLADGVNALHSAGKLHRDIKPGNVLVTHQGRLVLLDFGLTAELDRTGQYLSLQPRLLGTIAYMAPEQAACQPVGPATDWYAVGAMLYEALTGRLPFMGSPFQVLFAKQQLEAPSPRSLICPSAEDLGLLCEELLRRDPAARPGGAEIRRRLGGSSTEIILPGQSSQPVPLLQEVPLIGRHEQLRQLADAFTRVRQGRTVVVSVHGRSGAGKSALVRHFLDSLVSSSQAVVLAGRCYEQESVPYKALDSLVDALSRYLESLPGLEVEALLPRDIAPLTRLFPVLGQSETIANAPRHRADVSDPGEIRRRALTGLRELLARLGDRRPLVLAIDDLQWGDEDSAAVLADLLLPPDPPLLMLLASYRSEDIADSACLRAFGKIGQGEDDIERLDLPLAPLSEEERRELAQALLGTQGRTARLQTEVIVRQSGGFPFFIHELARFLRDGQQLPAQGERPAGDLTLDAVLWVRVLRLPAEARRLLEVVAVGGRPLPVQEAFAAAKLTEDPTRAVVQLRNERLVRTVVAEQAEYVETYHDRIREAVVLHLPATAQAEHHWRLAEVLEATGTAEPEWLAVHFLGAGQPVRAGHYFALAGDRAASALAFDQAARMYRQALELRNDLDAAQRRRLTICLGDALARAGRSAEAAREFLAAADGAAPEEAREQRRRAALVLLSSGHIDLGLSTLRDVLASVGLAMPGSPVRTFWALVWQRLKLRLRGLRFHRRTIDQVPAADLAQLDVCMTAAVGLSMVDTIQGAYFQSRSLLLALRAGEPGRLVSALAVEGGHESIGGTANRRRTRKLLDTAEKLAKELGEPYPLGMVSLARGLAAALAGDWPQGRTLCERAEGIFREECTGVMWELGTAHRFTLWPLIFMGELVEAGNRLPGLIKEARERDDLYAETNLCLIVRTFLRLAADEPARARQELHELMERWSHAGFHVQHMNRLFDDTQIDLYEGAGVAGWKRITGQWELLERSQLLRIQQIRILLRHLRGRAALAATLQGENQVQEAQRMAMTLLHEGAGWSAALGRLLQAGIASRRGQKPEALQLLREAAGMCEATHMRLYAASARLLLAECTGGTEGEALRSEAEAWMRGQRVANPARLAALLVPGFASR